MPISGGSRPRRENPDRHGLCGSSWSESRAARADRLHQYSAGLQINALIARIALHASASMRTGARHDILNEMRTPDSLLISDLRRGYIANIFTPAEIMAGRVCPAHPAGPRPILIRPLSPPP